MCIRDRDTDGACSGNPGPGGWGVVLIYGTQEKELSGAEKATTNQRMELTAALQALQALKEPCEVLLFSDSAYLINAFTQHWLDNWQRNGWRNAKKQPVDVYKRQVLSLLIERRLFTLLVSEPAVQTRQNLQR